MLRAVWRGLRQLLVAIQALSVTVEEAIASDAEAPGPGSAQGSVGRPTVQESSTDLPDSQLALLAVGSAIEPPSRPADRARRGAPVATQSVPFDVAHWI